MRKNYYEHQRTDKPTPYEPKKKYNHDGKTITVKSINDLQELALDYVSTKRGGTYFEAFDMVRQLIGILEKQSRAIEDIQRNYTI